jgi:hypothetical protein
MCLFLIAPDARRLLDFFVLGRVPAPPSREWIFRRPVFDAIGVAVRTLAVLWTAGHGLYTSHEMRNQMILGPKIPLHGLWEVEQFELEGRELPPLATDSRRWNRLLITDYSQIVGLNIYPMTGAQTRMQVKVDDKSIRATPNDPSKKAEFVYELSGKDKLTLTSKQTIEGKEQTIKVQLKRMDPSNFTLQNRGFHWISELPYNR